MANAFRKGDKVQWNSPQGMVMGTVVRKLTDRTQINGHHVHATEDDPQYLVESDHTGAQAAHKPSALMKLH